jgi:hypothetical protein
MLDSHDIVLITGGNAVGKTTASNHFRDLAALHKISYENCIISDSECLFLAMLEDDKAGGLHHTHNWCGNPLGHSHNSGQPLFPFIVTDNELPGRMRNSFFKKIQSLESKGNFWFVEWAAGVNINPSEDPVSCIDYSYKLINQLMHERILPDGWLIRVKTVLHITAEKRIRCMLNNKRSEPLSVYPEALGQGTASWLKDERIIRFYGRDDFSEIECLFKGIPIHKIENDGTPSYFQKLDVAAQAIFESKVLEHV